MSEETTQWPVPISTSDRWPRRKDADSANLVLALGSDDRWRVCAPEHLTTWYKFWMPTPPIPQPEPVKNKAEEALEKFATAKDLNHKEWLLVKETYLAAFKAGKESEK